MKFAPVFASVLATFALPLLAADKDDEEHVPTQAEMNQQAADDLAKADKEMTETYAKLKATLDKAGQAKLKAAQKAWIGYRDAEAASEAAPNEGGSVYAMVYAQVQQRITENRTEELSLVLEGDEEQAGDDDGGDSSDE